MNFRPLQESDIAFMSLHALYGKEHWKAMPGQTEYNYTLEHDGKVLVIGGAKMLNNYTAYAWIDLSEFAKEHIIITYRCIKEWMLELAKTVGIRRYEAYIECGFEAGHNIARHLGFELEYRAKNFFGDAPADIYAIVFKEKL
jgi:hypothetical protein